MIKPVAGLGVITPGSYTLKIGKFSDPGPVQVFSGTGSVIFSRGAIATLNPLWFGITEDTDCAAALQRAFNSVDYGYAASLNTDLKRNSMMFPDIPTNPEKASGSFASAVKVVFPAGRYRIDSQVTIPGDLEVDFGHSSWSSYVTSASTSVFKIRYGYRNKIHNLLIANKSNCKNAIELYGFNRY
jgi:hypothetical protein